MPAVQVEETEFLANKQLAQAYQAMLNNPKSRDLLEKAIKVINPQAATPITDAKSEVLAIVEEERKERLALQKRIDDEAEARKAADAMNQFRNKWQSDLARIRDAKGYTAEGVAAVEKLAEERGITDLDAASALFDQLHPPAAPLDNAGIGGFNAFNMFEPTQTDDADFKKLLESKGDDGAALNAMIGSALKESRQVGRR